MAGYGERYRETVKGFGGGDTSNDVGDSSVAEVFDWIPPTWHKFVRTSHIMAPKQRLKKGKEDTSALSSEKPEEDNEAIISRARSDTQKKKEGGCLSLLKKFGYFSLIIIVPCVLNYAALSQEAKVLVPKDGVLYDIGWGQKLLLRCTGKGQPTVVLEAPIGQTSDVWTRVQAIIARKTRVCLYDRAGIGFSDAGYRNTSESANDFSLAAQDRDRTEVSTVERMTDDLHRLLSYSTSQPKPLLLVGIDFSTFITRFYTQLYEHEVAGLFLIDPAIETLLDFDPSTETAAPSSNQLSLKWPEFWNKKLVPSAYGKWLSSLLGFTRVALMLKLTAALEEPGLKEVLPDNVFLRKKHFLCQPRHQSAAYDELRQMNKSMNQLKTVLRVKPFPSQLPVVIATFKDGDSSTELRKAWTSGQSVLSHSLLPQSKHILLPGEDYLSLYKYPQQVAIALLESVENWRKQSEQSA